MKRVENLLKIASMTFQFWNLKIGFQERRISFLVVKTAKCKRGINQVEGRTILEMIMVFYKVIKFKGCP